MSYKSATVDKSIHCISCKLHSLRLRTPLAWNRSLRPLATSLNPQIRRDAGRFQVFCSQDAGQKKVVVVGGGVGGLSVAGRLSKAGFKVTLLEKNAQVGGPP